MKEKNIIFSSEEYEAAYQYIKNMVIEIISGVQEPVAIILGGQPGAGKSSIYDTTENVKNYISV